MLSMAIKDYKINEIPAIDFWGIFVLDSKGIVRYAGRGMGSIDYRQVWATINELTQSPSSKASG